VKLKKKAIKQNEMKQRKRSLLCGMKWSLVDLWACPFIRLSRNNGLLVIGCVSNLIQSKLFLSFHPYSFLLYQRVILSQQTTSISFWVGPRKKWSCLVWRVAQRSKPRKSLIFNYDGLPYSFSFLPPIQIHIN